MSKKVLAVILSLILAFSVVAVPVGAADVSLANFNIENFFNQYPKNALNSWGRYRSDDLLITTLSAGSFILQFDDPSAVESVEISVTDMGHVRLAHSVEGYCCIAGDFLSICLDQNGLQQAIHPSEGGLTMFWQISQQLKRPSAIIH